VGPGVPIVYNDDGIDVTPKPLHSLKPTVLGPKGAGGLDKTPGDVSPTSEVCTGSLRSSRGGGRELIRTLTS